MNRKDVTIYRGDYIHESAKIGRGTRIGTGHDIGKDVEIGEDCNIQCGVSISNEWKIRNRVFIGPGVRFFNDKYPLSKRLQAGVVEDDAIICGGVLIGPGVNIGRGAVIGMGANIRKDVPTLVVVVEDGSHILYDRDVYDGKRRRYESHKLA